MNYYKMSLKKEGLSLSGAETAFDVFYVNLLKKFYISIPEMCKIGFQ